MVWDGPLEKGSILSLEHTGIKVIIRNASKIGSFYAYFQVGLMTPSLGQENGSVPVGMGLLLGALSQDLFLAMTVMVL